MAGFHQVGVALALLIGFLFDQRQLGQVIVLSLEC